MTGLQLFDFICLLAGFILFVLAAFNVVIPRPDRPAINLVALGLAVWILVPLVHLLAAL